MVSAFNDPIDREVALYDRAWSRIQLEISLINQRLTWLFTLQGFLFTAYGFSLSAQAAALGAQLTSTQPTASEHFADAVLRVEQHIHFARLILGYAGVISATLTAIGVAAARNTVAFIVISWKARPAEIRDTIPLPPLGARPTNRTLGLATAFGPSIMLIILWAALVGDLLLIGVAAACVILTIVVIYRKIAELHDVPAEIASGK
jgi:hypothetical protein